MRLVLCLALVAVLVTSSLASGTAVFFPSPPPPLLDTAYARRAREGIGRLARRERVKGPRADGRLDGAAGELAARRCHGMDMDERDLQGVLSAWGVGEPAAASFLARGPAARPEWLVDQLVEQQRAALGRLLRRRRPNRIGVGMSPCDGRAALVVLLLSSHVVLRPLPRWSDRAGGFHVEGRVTRPFSRPRVVYTDASGAVREVHPGREGDQIDAFLPCRGIDGVLQAEILAEGPLGPAVLVNVPLTCGRGALGHGPGQSSAVPVEDAMADRGRMAHQLLRWINDLRRGRGLEPLLLHPAASRVARAHSEHMERSGLVGHLLPGSAPASERLRAAGITSAVVLENIATGPTLGEAHRGLASSPGHLAAMVHPLVTHAGIGVVRGRDEEGRPWLYVSELFFRIPPPLDVDRGRQRLRGLVQARRAWIRRPDLAAAAQAIAEAMASRGLSPGEATGEIRRLAGGRFQGLRRIVTATQVVTALDQLDPDSLLDGLAGEVFGEGLAQGFHEDLGEGARFIVLVVGEVRGDD